MPGKTQYIVEIYFSETGNHIGNSVFGDERTLDFYEEQKFDYDIIFHGNRNRIYGKAPQKYINKEESFDSSIMEGSVLKCIKKKIFVDKYFYQRKDSGEWIICEKKLV